MPRRRRRSASPPPYQVAPGVTRRRLKVHWELVSCGLGGHALVGTDAAEVHPEDYPLVREGGGLRWHRCLRCDTWTVLPPPDAPARGRVPGRDEIVVPLRGRPLRQRFVLRLIAVEKALHVIVFGLLAAAVLLFAAHRASLRADYRRVARDFGANVLGGNPHHGLTAWVDRAFTLPVWEVTAVGVALAAYGCVLLLEIVGLWRARRWAEYLALFETVLLVPYEIYDLAGGVSALKVATLVVNVAILAYLALAHRLLGLRGGVEAMHRAEEQSSGWTAVDRATPPLPEALRGAVPATT